MKRFIISLTIMLCAYTMCAQSPFFVGSASQEAVHDYNNDNQYPILDPTSLQNPSTYQALIKTSSHYHNFSLDQTSAANKGLSDYLRQASKNGRTLGPASIEAKLGKQDTIVTTQLTAQGKQYDLICLIDGSDGQGIGDLATVIFATEYPKLLSDALQTQDNPKAALAQSLNTMHDTLNNMVGQTITVDVTRFPQFASSPSVKITDNNLPRGGILAVLLNGTTAYIGGVTDSEILIARNKKPLKALSHFSQDQWIGAQQLTTINPQTAVQTINVANDEYILLFSDGVVKALKKYLNTQDSSQIFDRVYTRANEAITKVGTPTASNAKIIAADFISRVIDDYNTSFLKANETYLQTKKKSDRVAYSRDDISAVFIFPRK